MSAHPGMTTVLSSWTVQPLVLVAAVAALAWYLRATSRLPERWPARRTVSFVAGLLLLCLVCCGPAARYGRSLYWVWVSQVLTLLLIVPLPVMAGQPIELCRLRGNTIGRLVGRLRVLRSPLFGPALLPVICAVTVFGPVPGAAAASRPVAWLLQLVLVGLGSVIVFPLVALDDSASSIAIGVALAVGFVELLVDAIPGIVLRLSTHPASGFFRHRLPLAGALPWLHDQQIGGAVLWCVSESLDLPFLILIFRRWVRADAREAVLVDASLDHQQAQQETDEPWFYREPQLRDRLR